MAGKVSIDRAFLAAAGLCGLAPDDQFSLLEAIVDELQTRVGTRLSQAMTAQQMGEFERLMAAGNQDASAYLDRVTPWHREAVVEEVGILRALLLARAPQILAARGARDG